MIAIGAIAGSIGIGASQAQIREQQPAEFPPASYKGKQYVDSKGCVFVRAGIDGNVSWIPRVTRDRKTICGFTPSLAGQVAAAPAPAPAEAPVQITIDDAPAAAPTAAPAPKPRAVAQAPAPKPRVVRRAPSPAPAPVVRQPVAVAQAPQPQITRQTDTRATACPNASQVGQRYLPRNGTAVRCGPQQAPIVAGSVAGGTVVQSTGTVVTSQTRIVPKHVAINRQNTRNVTVPKGYEPAWSDGRLNPHRAEQNLAGRRDMLLIWTNTLPRRLVDRRTGKDMTASIPLVYPYLDLAEQRREIGLVTIVQKDGKTVKRIQRSNKSNAVPLRKPVITTRSAPKAAPKPVAVAAAKPKARAVPSGARLVQVGTFADPANAQKTAQRVANMGLPARIGKVRRKGKTYMVVQSGPFVDGQNTARALQKLRRAGYADAFARR